MRILRQLGALFALAAGLGAAAMPLAAQVTTSSMSGTVRTSDGKAIAGAIVNAVHQPSGSMYSAVARADGRFTIPGMRVGGPYTLSARAIGYAKQSIDGVTLELGVSADIAIVLPTASAVQLKTVAVTAEAGAFSSNRTGAATRVSAEALQAFPTIGRTITDFTRLTPQSTSGGSFAGIDSRFNNITIDGSYFNNSFGLGSQPGARTSVSPIPLDAVDQVQINIAPYDVRQGNFVGAGVNAVTKSGTNNFTGALYYNGRNQDYVGTTAGANTVNPGTFKFGQVGGYLGGPIIQNKLFFFGSYEKDKFTQPATLFTANAGGETVTGTKTRVLKSDLDSVSSFLKNKFGYDPGVYQGFNRETPSDRLLLKLDWNINDKNKFSVRYTQLNSSADQLASNSNSLGFGNRQGNLNSLNFSNEGYSILENIKSWVGELNSQIGSNMSNNLIVGYTKNDESRGYKSSTLFPVVDILNAGTTYMSFGFEPFTPANQLRYQTFQIQDNFNIYAGSHTFTAGATFQKYNSQNVFYPGSQSAYVFNSLADFFNSANGVAGVTLNTFQLRYNNIPGQVEPLQPLEVFTYGGYLQDEWKVNDNFSLTYGVRMDLPQFTNTTFANSQVDTLSLLHDRNGVAQKFSTSQLPSATPLWSPRAGFSWFLNDSHATRLRGGTGIFTGQPAYVWISNQIGQNGVITGFQQLNNTTLRPFNPNPLNYAPAASSITGAPAASYELDFTDKNFKFPQLWRSNIAIDQKLPFGFIATLEGLYSKDVNGMYYYNANLPAAQTAYTGTVTGDNRPRWLLPAGSPAGTVANRIYSFVNPGAYVLANQNVGYSYSTAASLEKSFQNGFFFKVAYNQGVAKNTIDPGSIATGTFNGNTQSGNPNQVGLGYGSNTPGKRFIAALSYKASYFGFGATTLSIFGEGVTQGNTDYTFSGDANGDGATSNDLLYIAKDTSQMNFQQYTIGAGASAVTVTRAAQQAAWDAYVNQDPYLSKHRGEYMQRGALFLPMVFRADASIVQDVYVKVGGKKNQFQVRIDILNVGNLLNKDWGVGDRVIFTQPFTNPSADATGALQYRLRSQSTTAFLPATATTQKTAGLSDVYRFQLGVRYSFY